MPAMYDILQRKKAGEALSTEEINFFVAGFTSGEIPDYQASALLMAICLRGMDDREAADLTGAMMRSGDVIDLSAFGTRTADKHSTGGIGDKTTLIVAPLAAALGCIVPKMSGRGLGHTGGTVDKLEAIPGYRTTLTRAEMEAVVSATGLAVVGQSGDLAPADKRLYALRDVTATVDSIPLIASSIMSKKLASGAANIVLDVKVGNGAFMKTEEDARRLAQLMVSIGRAHGRRVIAVLSDMDAPLGYAVGNAVEVREAVEVLRGKGCPALRSLSLTLAALLAEASLGIEREDALQRAEQALDNGEAISRMLAWITAQGGDAAVIENTDLLPTAAYTRQVKATADGYLGATDAEAIGRVAVILGAGRAVKDERIDPAAGILFHKQPGDPVHCGEAIATLLTSERPKMLDTAEKSLLAAMSIVDLPPMRPTTVIDIID